MQKNAFYLIGKLELCNVIKVTRQIANNGRPTLFELYSTRKSL